MQTALYKIWTQIIDSIFYDSNHYAISLINLQNVTQGQFLRKV